MTVKRLIGGMLAVLVIALVMAPSLMAQTLISGDVTGTVTDPSGAVVPNASVTLKSNATGATRTTTTNATGAYRFSLLPPGSYTVSVTAPGFSKAEMTTMINIGQATIADVKLAVGSSSQTVEVTSAAPLVSTENAGLNTTFDQSVIVNQPNPGNDLTYIAQTAPGVNMNSGMGYGNFNTAGLPATSNVFTLNGENDMDPYLNLNNSGATNLLLGKNDVQEATVVTNAYGAQYGQQAGVQVNYVTKSGTNAFHGNAQYWWTGASMDANSWFNDLSKTAKPFNNNNEWVASIGGPIKKDKLFFFVDTEGIRYIVPSTGTVYFPTASFATQTLANIAATQAASLPLYTKAFNLYATSPWALPASVNNTINNVASSCQGATNSVGVPLTNCFYSTTANPSEPAKEWMLIGRVDYNLSDKDHLFWRASFDHGTQATYADPVNPNFNIASYQPQYNGQGEWTHTFGGTATNQLIYAGSYYRAIFNEVNGPATFPTWLDLGGIGYTSLANISSVFPQGRDVTQYQIIDDFSVTKGEHSLKFGVNFRRYDLTDFYFSEWTTPLSYIGSVQDLYIGNALEFVQNFPNRLSYPVALWGMGLYAQDEWRISKNLKLTFALRAEHDSNPVCQLNCNQLMTGPFTSVSTNPATPYNQMINANLHQVFSGTDKIDWAPRFGFAWSPGGNDKTVVRGGFGIFYDAFPAFLGDSFMSNLPTVVPITQYGQEVTGSILPWADRSTAGLSPWLIGSSTASAIRSCFPTGASYNSFTTPGSSCYVPGFATPSFTNMSGTFHTPRYQEWSLQIQQQLDSKSSMTLAYIGNHGIHEGIFDYPNAYGPAGFPAAPYSAYNFSGVTQVYSGAVSNDNQLTASYQRRLTYGFTVSASYTWAHAMDEVSNGGVLAYSSTSASYQYNPLNLRSNYGNADYDIRSSFNALYTWNTPWKFSNKWVNGAFGGWVFSENFFVRSGLPLTVFDNTTPIGNYNYTGTPYAPAQVVGPGQSACGPYLLTCLNPAGFMSIGTLTAFPNQQRNQYRGPGFFDSDFTINKNFKLTERVAFGIGANMYNVFNHPNFEQPLQGYGTPTFGNITGQAVPPTGPFGSFFAGAPSNRIIQFQGRIVF